MDNSINESILEESRDEYVENDGSSEEEEENVHSRPQAK
jgi:hypothetical protein